MSRRTQELILTREEQKSHWDLKYEQGLPSLTEPDPFFLSAYERFVEPLFPNAGSALDLACGLGRHALWLAGRNWRGRGVALSDVARQKLKRDALAGERGPPPLVWGARRE